MLVPCGGTAFCSRPVPPQGTSTSGNGYAIPTGMAMQPARLDTLTRELAVLDAQRRGLVAEIKALTGPRVNAGSVTSRVLGYLRRVGGPATTPARSCTVPRSTPRSSESYRVSRRPHCLGGWGLWDVQVGFLRKCANVPSGGSRSTGRPTPQRGRCCSRWRRSSAARRRRCGRGCGRRSVMLGIGRA